MQTAGPPAVSALGRAAPRRDELVLLTAALAWATAFVHAVASVEHFAHYWLFGVFFAVLATVQFGWGVAVYRRPVPGLLLAGALGSIAVVLLWVFTRTIGPPVGPEAWSAEVMGAPDLAATVTQCLTAQLALALRHDTAPAQHLVLGRGAASARWLAYPALILTVLAAFLGGHGH